MVLPKRERCLIIYVAQGNALLAGDAGAVLVLGGEVRLVPFRPAELAAHRAPRRLDRVRTALELVALGGVAADAERRRLPEEDGFERGEVRFLGEDAEHDAGAVFLHLDRRREDIEGASGKQEIEAKAD